MWGGIFNMAVEGLGKYTAIASGIFMTMVFGCAVMVAIQGWVADMTDYMTSYWVVLFSAAYILFYAAIGSKPSKSQNKTTIRQIMEWRCVNTHCPVIWDLIRHVKTEF